MNSGAAEIQEALDYALARRDEAADAATWHKEQMVSAGELHNHWAGTARILEEKLEAAINGK